MTTIADIVVESTKDTGEFSLLLRALELTGLDAAVADPTADFTVFAPTDQAFINLARSLGVNVPAGDKDAAFDGIASALGTLGDPLKLLSEVLLYHVSPTAKSLDELQSAGTITTAQSGGATFEVNGRELVDNDPQAANPNFVTGLTDLVVSNGTIQVIDEVLLPIDIPQAAVPETLADLVLTASGSEGFDGNADDFDILREALIATDLVGAVADPNADLSVFAPTDGAFVSLARSLGAEVADGDDAGAFAAIQSALVQLTGSEEAALATLKEVLLYHVSAEGRSIEELQGEVLSLQGNTLHINGNSIGDNDPSRSDAQIIDEASNLLTGNGIAQAIDQVLLPIDLPEARDPEAAERLVGSRADDTFFGAGDNDKVFGRRGDDALDGGSGNDNVRGGRGDDLVFGGDGNDKLSGGRGDDIVIAGEGHDRVRGGNGDDFVSGGAGDDRIFAGNGNDIIEAGAGNDRIGGNGGHDQLLFRGDAADYAITRKSHNLFEFEDMSGDDGSDLVGGVELFSFADGSFSSDGLQALAIGDVISAGDLLEDMQLTSDDVSIQTANGSTFQALELANLDLSAVVTSTDSETMLV